MNQNKNLKLISLEAEDVLKLRAVRIQADGKHVEITGANDQGKTSVLRCLEMALRGKDAVPGKPIREGAEKGQIVVDLGELVVKRTFTQKDSYLSIETKEGMEPKSPQKILDRMLGRDGRRGSVAFDPLEFAEMSPKKQAETLVKLMNIDLDLEDWEGEHVILTGCRTRAKQELTSAEVKDSMLTPIPEDTPGEEISVGQLMDELGDLTDNRQIHGEMIDGLVLATRFLTEANEDLEGLLAKVRTADKKVEAAKQDVLNRQEGIDSTVVVSDGEVAAVKEKIRTAEEVNKAVRQKKLLTDSKAELLRLRELVDACEISVQEHRERHAEALSRGILPMDGLTITPEGVVTFEGIPMDQLSDSKKLRVSMAVAMQLNPRLRVILIDRMELLDDENREVILDMASDHDYQVISTVVSSSPKETGVHILDGEVVAVDGKPQLKEVTP